MLSVKEIQTQYNMRQKSIALWAGLNPSIVSYYSDDPCMVTDTQRKQMEAVLEELTFLLTDILPPIQEALPGFVLDLQNVPAAKQFLKTAKEYIETQRAQNFVESIEQATHETAQEVTNV